MLQIREESPADIDAITNITAAAFAGQPYSRQTEPFVVLALRMAGALALSLVADDDGDIVGHVAFSPVTINGRDCGWYGVGPVSVRPDRQRLVQPAGQARQQLLESMQQQLRFVVIRVAKGDQQTSLTGLEGAYRLKEALRPFKLDIVKGKAETQIKRRQEAHQGHQGTRDA